MKKLFIYQPITAHLLYWIANIYLSSFRPCINIGSNHMQGKVTREEHCLPSDLFYGCRYLFVILTLLIAHSQYAI